MNETLRSELVGTAGLGAAAPAALLLTPGRTPTVSDRTGRQRTTLVYAALVFAQLASPPHAEC